MKSHSTRETSLQFLEGLLAEPQNSGPLRLVPASRIDTEKFSKTKHTGLSVGNYGLGDSEFFFQDQTGNLYPVVGDFPVLLFPERLTDADKLETVSLKLPQYEEAYTEMEHYNNLGDESTNLETDLVRRHMAGAAEPGADLTDFPDPPETWIDAVHDSTSQYEAYKYLAPIENKTFLQIGGSGTHVVKALMGGASIGVLLTPMAGEARYALSLARHFGVSDRFFAVIGVGEELPFKEQTFDAIYSGGCLHHMQTEMAFKEMRKVLKPGGRFACVDPWKTRLHGIGTKLLGKREVSVFCRPIDHHRLEPIKLFEKHIVRRHGPVLRYVFLGLWKFGIELSPVSMMRITKIDDAIGRLTGKENWGGGSILICGER